MDAIDPHRFYTVPELQRRSRVRREVARAIKRKELKTHSLDGRGPRVQGAEWLRWLESREG